MISVYLAGPMRGVPQFNFPSFAEARERLRSMGYEVLCPAERDEVAGFDASGMKGSEDLESLGFDLAAAMKLCFQDILNCDAVVLLPGWQQSEGARAEALVGLLTGRDLFAYYRHRPNVLEPLDGLRIPTRVEAY